jgi:NitT/TauT family transport system ATP-binding protein
VTDRDADLARQEAFLLAMNRSRASADEIVGLLKVLARLSFSRRLGFSDLADALSYDEEKLVVLLELLELLGFAEVVAATIKLTLVGRQYARATEHARRIILADQLVKRIPLVARVRDLLERNRERGLTLREIEPDLRERFGTVPIAGALRQVILWAHGAGLLSFDASTGAISLKRPGPAHSS